MDQVPLQRPVPGWKQWPYELLEDHKHMFAILWASKFFQLFPISSAVNLKIIANKDLHFLPFSEKVLLQLGKIMFLFQFHLYCLFIKNYVEDLYRLKGKPAVVLAEPSGGGGWRAKILEFFDVGLPFRKFLPIFPASVSVMFCANVYLWAIQNLYKP